MKNNTITIICPIYNAESYLNKLDKTIKEQKKVNVKEIKYLYTESDDNTEKILKDKKIKYDFIKKGNFSHSLTREKAAFESKGDILVFITQDIIPVGNDWLFELVNPIIRGEVEACFSRQLCTNNSIEKYTREKNYPEFSRVVSKDDIERVGINAFFFSDASSAIRKDIFIELNGYDSKDMPTNEDMYIAYKILQNGYKIKYCSTSKVIHSHNFKLRELYERYRLTGAFFKQNPYLDKYGTTNSGSNLAKYVLKRIIQEHNFKMFFRYPFDMAARLFGMRKGKK